MDRWGSSCVFEYACAGACSRTRAQGGRCEGEGEGEETGDNCKLVHAHANAQRKQTETLCHCGVCSIIVSVLSWGPAHHLRPKHELYHDMRVITRANQPGLADAQFWIAMHVAHPP